MGSKNMWRSLVLDVGYHNIENNAVQGKMFSVKEICCIIRNINFCRK